MPFIIPVIAGVAAAVGTVTAALGAAFTAIGLSAGLATSLAGFIVRYAIVSAISWAASKLFAPKMGQALVASRQASVLQLDLGEGPREAAFGRCALGGRLRDAFNYGTDFEWEVLVIKLADHEVDALEQVIVNDRVYDFTADGLQTHADFVVDGVSHLEIHFRPGTLTQTPPAGLVSVSAGRWTSNDVMKGCAHVWVAYKVSDKVWPTGRPSLRWVGRWKKCYDARKDSTVPGGSGAHRWNDPSTHEWTDNAYVCWYNFQRGVWTNGQLMVGPGRSEEEQPAARMIAPANACDEDVTLKAGGTEKRYRANGLVRADERWIDVCEDFALAMAGEIVERDGGWEIDVGVARTVDFTFTDRDILANAPLEYQAKLGRAELVNTVTATYVSPSKLYNDHSAPLRRSSADVTADGEPRERSMPLVYVHSDTQAQRCSEIARRKARRMRQATVPLSMRFMRAEVGDWCEWTSERYFGGQTIKFVVVGVGIDPATGVSLALREIHSDVFGWTAATDELDALAPDYLPPAAPGAAGVASFAATPFPIVGADSVQRPGVKCTFTAPTDQTIVAIRFDWRPDGGGQIVSDWALAPFTGEHVLVNVPADFDIEVRATPETDPQRANTTTSWVDVHTPVETALVNGYLTNESHTVATASDGSGGSFTGAGGTFVVRKGTVDKTGAGPAYSVVGTPTGGLSISINASSGVYTVSGMSGDAGQATLRAVYDGVTIDRVYSLAKAKAGAPGADGDDGGDGVDGVSPTTAFLTNESHVVATASDGSGGDYSTAGGTLKVFVGATDVTTSSTFSVVGTPTGGLSISINATSGVYTVTGMTSDAGQATLRAVHGGVTIDKVYSLAKAKTGAAGDPGAPGGVVSKSATVTDIYTSGTSKIEAGRCAFGSTATGGSWRTTLTLRKEFGGSPTAVSNGPDATFNGNWEIIETSTGGTSGTVLATSTFQAVDASGIVTLTIANASSVMSDLVTSGARDVVARVWRASGSNELQEFTVKLTVEYIPPS